MVISKCDSIIFLLRLEWPWTYQTLQCNRYRPTERSCEHLPQQHDGRSY